MTKRLIGQRVLRNEDARLLTGQAQFVDDVEIPGLLHAAFLRSDHAHARLLGLDVSAARQRPGVVDVFTAEDLGADWAPGPPLVSPPPRAKAVTFHSRRQVPLVKDKVRHAGEAIESGPPTPTSTPPMTVITDKKAFVKATPILATDTKRLPKPCSRS